MNVRHALRTVLAAAALAAAAAAPAVAQSPRDSVLATLTQLLDAMHAKDSAAMAAAFAPGAHLAALDRLAPPDSQFKPATPEQFVARMLGYPVPITERLLDPEVTIDNDVAQVAAYYDVRFGERFSHCGTNFFHVGRVRGRWMILALSWTRRREGCRDR